MVSEKHGLSKKQLGAILRILREEKSLTREWVAERADIGLRHLAAIELGEKYPSVDTLYRLVRVIGISSDRVFYPEHDAGEDDLEQIMLTSATCTAKQRKLVIQLIRAVVDSGE